MGRIKDRHERAMRDAGPPLLKLEPHPKMLVDEDTGLVRCKMGPFSVAVAKPFGAQEYWDTLRTMEVYLSTAVALERDHMTVNGEPIGG